MYITELGTRSIKNFCPTATWARTIVVSFSRLIIYTSTDGVLCLVATFDSEGDPVSHVILIVLSSQLSNRSTIKFSTRLPTSFSQIPAFALFQALFPWRDSVHQVILTMSQQQCFKLLAKLRASVRPTRRKRPNSGPRNNKDCKRNVERARRTSKDLPTHMSAISLRRLPLQRWRRSSNVTLSAVSILDAVVVHLYSFVTGDAWSAYKATHKDGTLLDHVPVVVTQSLSKLPEYAYDEQVNEYNNTRPSEPGVTDTLLSPVKKMVNAVKALGYEPTLIL
ncbi:unnamed protein product [Somion occarium]|uniref:Uncharacterized protein n=1 Tax=Somion occarium TaxID=3059160 RepID=A0ABP1D5Q6_9APHY